MFPRGKANASPSDPQARDKYDFIYLLLLWLMDILLCILIRPKIFLLHFLNNYKFSRLVLYVYEYLVHMNAKNAAQTFLQEVLKMLL